MSLIEAEVVKILCCPETHQLVTEAPAAIVADLNTRIATDSVKNRTGKLVKDKIDGALIRSDRSVVYPIRQSIPIMLAEEAIPLV